MSLSAAAPQKTTTLTDLGQPGRLMTKVRYATRLSEAEADNTVKCQGWPRAIALFGTVGPIYVIADDAIAWREAERIARRDDFLWKCVYAMLMIIAASVLALFASVMVSYLLKG
ncbi:MAG: hypothetical protein J0H10_15870 [Alphaproteobacteria bacterium]|nr:hypothetical protein [Alphaproteobacteria bacterium]